MYVWLLNFLLYLFRHRKIKHLLEKNISNIINKNNNNKKLTVYVNKTSERVFIKMVEPHVYHYEWMCYMKELCLETLSTIMG